jgi:hydrogenase 3 maturation protease
VKKKLVLTVGNGMMGDDAAGVMLARMLSDAPLDDWEVLNGGSAPENILHQARALAPEYILVVDAADMDLPAGMIRKIQDDYLDDPFLLTTHTLPLTYLIQSLREFVPRVELLGIQPEVVAFGYPVSPAVKQAVLQLYEGLKEEKLDWENLEFETYQLK